MKNLLLRIFRSPRVGWVALAVCTPPVITMAFAPVWAIAASMACSLGAIAFMYAVVLSPKYVHSPDAMNPAQYYKDAAARIAVAQAEIREALELATVSALDLGHRLQNLQVNHDAQVHLAKHLLSRSTPLRQDELTLADLSAMSNALLKKQNAQFKGIVETSVSMIKQLQINAIDAGHPEEVQELQGLVSTLRNALQDASDEVLDMSARLNDKLEEAAETLVALDELTEDTNGQVRDAVIAMQYHDITTQKLVAVERIHLAGLQEKTLEKLSKISPGEAFIPPTRAISPLAQLVEQRLTQDAHAKPSGKAQGTSPVPHARQEHAVELFE